MNAMRPKLLLTAFLLLCFSCSLLGQSISGRVIAKELSEVLPFTNVVILNASDSSYVTGTTTNDEGLFSINVPQKPYLLKVTFLGYEAFVGKVTSADMGTIYLTPKSDELSEVIITGTAKTFQMEKGGISADIQNSRLKDMASLPDILGQLPFVLKDQDSYTILGKGSPTFYINNRQVRNNDDLKQIDPKNVKKVTVITNPGAEYDATISAIIKIETTRPVGEGISGDVYTFNRYNNKWSTLDRVSLNYRKAKFDIFGSIQFADMSFPKDRILTYTIQTPTVSTKVLSGSEENDKLEHLIPRGGFNYIINKKQSLGVKYEYSKTNFPSYKSAEIEVFKFDNKEEEFDSETFYKSKEYKHYTNAYYDGELSEWITVKLNIDYNTANNGNNTNIVMNDINMKDRNIITSEKSTTDFYGGKLVLATPVWNGNLTYGSEASYTHRKQGADVIENTGNDPGLVASTNRVKQNLYAGFVSYDKSWDKLSGALGLRYENVQSTYFQNDILVDEQSKVYNRLFPNVRLSYAGEKVQMELAYKNSVQRPSYSELRSAIYYQAPYSYFSGEPLLKPSYKNSLTFMLMWNKFTFMTVYNDDKDRVLYIPQLYLGNSILNKPMNVSKSQNLTITANYAPTIGIWKPSIEVSMAKDYIKIGTPVIKYNDPLIVANLRNNILIKDWQIGFDMRIRSRGYRDAEYNRGSWTASTYVNKSFFDKKLSTSLLISDIFATSEDTMLYQGSGVSIHYDNKMYRRNAILQLTYRFNATNNRYKGSRASDELDRL